MSNQNLLILEIDDKLQKLFLFYSLIKTGFKRELTREDLWEVDESETAQNVTKRLEDSWNKKAKEYIAKIRANPELEKPPKVEKKKPKKKQNKAIYKANGTNKEEEVLKLNVCKDELEVFNSSNILSNKGK